MSLEMRDQRIPAYRFKHRHLRHWLIDLVASERDVALEALDAVERMSSWSWCFSDRTRYPQGPITPGLPEPEETAAHFARAVRYAVRRKSFPTERFVRGVAGRLDGWRGPAFDWEERQFGTSGRPEPGGVAMLETISEARSLQQRFYRVVSKIMWALEGEPIDGLEPLRAIVGLPRVAPDPNPGREGTA